MPLLIDLKEQLEKLPKKKELKILAGGMKKFEELVSDAAGILKASLDSVGFARTVFPDEDFGKAMTRMRQAASLARKLKKKLAEDMTAVQKTSTEQDVTRLVEQAKAARHAVRERWEELLSERVEPHEKLVGVVRELPELAPQGGAKLGELLDELRNRVPKPPATQREADEIRGSLDDLPRVIENLGLEGDVGEFLVQAASGLGDPEKLLRPAIREFFKGRGLWDLIRVKIR